MKMKRKILNFRDKVLGILALGSLFLAFFAYMTVVYVLILSLWEISQH